MENQDQILEQISRGQWSYIHYYFYTKLWFAYNGASLLLIFFYFNPTHLPAMYYLMSFIGVIAMSTIYFWIRPSKISRENLRRALFDHLIYVGWGLEGFIGYFFIYKKMRGKFTKSEILLIQEIHTKIFLNYVIPVNQDSTDKQSVALKNIKRYDEFLHWSISQTKVFN